MAGLFTGHCHLKEHLFKLGLTNDPTCEGCLEIYESATHILCDCGAIAYLRFRHLDQLLMEPGDYYDAPINKAPTFHSKCRINIGLIERGSIKIIDGHDARAGLLLPTPHTFIHSFKRCPDFYTIKFWKRQVWIPENGQWFLIISLFFLFWKN
jgi:hypothetical protein